MISKGKLKIFFGYSAGVGKTYAMLKSAIEQKQYGTDIVLGYFEPHDREDTISLTHGFETLPLKEISYRGISLKEFDVDAAINRNPNILLLDELAHTNALGSKNRKRYLDAEELLNNGINVWTTVNVQHIEGLHDIVGESTGVDVNERVPDEIFDYADEIVLIDIEPDELIERMNAGKIYKKNRAVTALENFFVADKLSSLRELFMRRSADRIEKISHNGMLKTKILALISPSPSSQKIIRTAARMAEAYHCKFSAIYVERNGDLTDDSSANLKKHMNLVRDMGGEIIVKYGDDVVEIVADYAKIAGVTNLILGKTWQSVGKKVGLEDEFIARLHDKEIIIVPDSSQPRKNRNMAKDLFFKIFKKQNVKSKYAIANKILDVINLLISAKLDDFKNQTVSEILSNTFERSCKIIREDSEQIHVFNNESVSCFNEDKEIAVANWCKKNNKSAGKGTDTLRESKAIYLPLIQNSKIIVIAFTCLNTKMTVTDKLIFNQISNTLKLVLIK